MTLSFLRTITLVAAASSFTLPALMFSSTVAAQHAPGSECIDTDGDGWGWTGTASCRISTTADAVCVDNDGDGWGWDGSNSCRIESATPAAGDCVDSDGDGWGWDGVASCRLDDDAVGLNLVETAVGAGNFTILATALQLTGLDAVLSDDMAEFTVFAPTDQAFEMLGQETINALIADPDSLAQILLSHVVPGRVDSTAALGLAGSVIATANGNVALSVNNGSLFVNTSEVIATDINASNGIIHVLDTVILPRPLTHASGTIVDVAVANGNLSTLVTALQATGLDTVLADASGDFTVFAPTNQAFAELGDEVIAALLSDTDTLSTILLTHVLAGTVDSTTALSLTGGSVTTASGVSVHLSIRANQLYVNDSAVVVADVVTDNGIVHIIDKVLN